MTPRRLNLALIALACASAGAGPAAAQGPAAAAGSAAAPGAGVAVAAATPLAAAAAQPVYRVARGDELRLRFTYTPELNIDAAVRSDGRVSLPLIGDLSVQGMTVQELIDLVERRLADQVKRPQVVININGAGSQRVFVGGEVTRPGVQPLVGPLTALQAVMAAEGLRDTAQATQALVLRRGAPGAASEVIRVDLQALMTGDGAALDPVLMPYDVVVVPRSGIASVNLWVDQYLRRSLPFSVGFSYSINRDSQVTR